MTGRRTSVADAASLIEVLLGDAAVSRGLATHHKPGPAHVSIKSTGTFHRRPEGGEGEGVVVCKDDYHVQLRNSDEETIAEIKASFIAAFSADLPGEPAEHELDEFAGSTGKLVIRPYAREFVQQMSTRMGVPAMTLEVLRFKGDVLPESGSEEETSGNGVNT